MHDADDKVLTKPIDSQRFQVSASRYIALASALITVALPLAVFLRETFAKDRELAVSRAEQEFKIRSAYLDRALDPARPAALRQGVLRFLVGTSDDPQLKAWAQKELALVEPEANELKGDLVKFRRLFDEKDERVQSLIDAWRNAGDSKAAAAKAEINALNRSKAELESRIARTTERLTGVVNLSGTSGGRAMLSADPPTVRVEPKAEPGTREQ